MISRVNVKFYLIIILILTVIGCTDFYRFLLSETELFKREVQVNTVEVTDISDSTAVLTGTIYNEGFEDSISVGFFIDFLNHEPTDVDFLLVTDYTDTVFSIEINNLQPNTQYYYRALAVSEFGMLTGLVDSFTTDEVEIVFDYGTISDNRDNRTYNTIQIGNQIWMAENLAYLPSVSPPSEGSNTESYQYVYGYEGSNINEAKATENYETYGVLYNWTVAMNACPSGWHLPSDDEWKELEMYIGMSQSEVDDIGYRNTDDEGKKLKATSGWNYNHNGTDEYGFGALPGGTRGYSGSFSNVGNSGWWWSATGNGNSTASCRSLSINGSDVLRGNYYRVSGYSVRCVRD